MKASIRTELRSMLRTLPFFWQELRGWTLGLLVLWVLSSLSPGCADRLYELMILAIGLDLGLLCSKVYLDSAHARGDFAAWGYGIMKFREISLVFVLMLCATLYLLESLGWGYKLILPSTYLFAGNAVPELPPFRTLHLWLNLFGFCIFGMIIGWAMSSRAERLHASDQTALTISLSKFKRLALTGCLVVCLLVYFFFRPSACYLDQQVFLWGEPKAKNFPGIAALLLSAAGYMLLRRTEKKENS